MSGAKIDSGAAMTLPAVLDLAAAEGFHATLLKLTEANPMLRLDASGVETLTLPCIQIILAASRNYDVSIDSASEAFVSAFEDLALDLPPGCAPAAAPDLVQSPDPVEAGATCSDLAAASADDAAAPDQVCGVDEGDAQDLPAAMAALTAEMPSMAPEPFQEPIHAPVQELVAEPDPA